jgi:hypothetical protein
VWPPGASPWPPSHSATPRLASPFDDEVARFFATTAACILVTAVGVPAYRNTQGGLPGPAHELAGYDRLMQQLTLQLNRPGRR